MTTYLAIDLGAKRTGLAVGDDETGIATPLTVLELGPGAALDAAILAAVRDEGADALVVGLPVNMDGTEGAPAKTVRAWADSIGAAAQRPVHLQDERLTSYDADQRMARSGRTHRQKKQLRDALAAVVILEDFLASRSE